MDDVEFDEFCDAENPRKIKYENIATASKRIMGILRVTPCVKSSMSERLDMNLYLKQEFLHRTGSFKERGVCNTLMQLDDEKKESGVVTASTGNHGVALSFHARAMGIKCIVVMPLNPPITKMKRCQSFGAKLVLHGQDIAAAKRYAMTIAKDKNMAYINGYDHPHVIEGQGTVGLEILEQVPKVDAIVVSVGGGSLITGVAVVVKELKPDVEIYGVETDKTCSMTESLKKNERCYFKIGDTLADGLAVNMVGVNTFNTLKGIVDKMLTVREEWVARAILHLIEDDKCIVEGGGAVPVAALMAGLLPNLKGKKVVAICSGGNIDTLSLQCALQRGMAAEGRLVKFKVTVPDRPGAVAELTHLIANLNVTMRDSIPEKVWMKSNVCSVEFRLVVETKGWEHTKEFVETMKKHYQSCIFPDMAEKPKPCPPVRRGPCLAANPACMQK